MKTASEMRVVSTGQLLALARKAQFNPTMETPDSNWLSINVQPAAWHLVAEVIPMGGDRPKSRLLIGLRMRENTAQFDQENPTVITLDVSVGDMSLLVTLEELSSSIVPVEA